MAGLYSKFKSAIGFGSDSSRNQTDGTNVDDQPLALEASKVSVDFKKIIRVGSLGTIYKGTFMEENCAVKVFNSGVVQKEALPKRDIASIIQHHPNVVLVHGLWYGSLANSLPNNDPALVMELCSISLDAYLMEKVNKSEVSVFRLVEKLDILSGVTLGMIYLHSKRIVHGSLSAKRVLLNFTGPSTDRKILAKVAGVHEMKLFTPDTVLRLEASVQRNSIMPPEVKDARKDVELTEPVDLFLFGCLIPHVASCDYPVPNTEAGLTEFQKRARFITGSYQHHVFETLMKRCLSEQPGARGTFEDVGKDLSIYQRRYGGKQAQKLEEQMREVEGRKAEAVSLESEVDQPKARSSCTTVKVSSHKPSAAAYEGNNFLPCNSVAIDHSRTGRLGEGSFAKVFKGEYEGKPCAVKVFKENVLKKDFPHDPADKLYSMLPAVKHTNIVQMYGKYHDHHKTKVATSIVMEVCDESLFEAIKKLKGRSTPGHKQKLLIQRDIITGMVYLHRLNIIHGNLHSGNVLLCHSDGTTVAKVADFDLTYRDPNTQNHLTTRFPDEHFFPPEIFHHKDPKEKWSLFTPMVDVFCFGELALEMANGSYPTPEKKAKNHLTLTELQRREKYLSKMGKSDKENLELIIRKCLSDTPEGRPSFTDILSDVERHLQKYGERSDLARVQDKAGSRSDSLHPHTYETSVDLDPQALEAANVTTDARKKDGAVSLDSKVEVYDSGSSQQCPCDMSVSRLPLPLEVTNVTVDCKNTVWNGSFAVVYQGTYKKKECAVKVFSVGIVKNLKEIEGSQLASIIQHHPNVVLVHGLWYDNLCPGNQPALVMELCNTNLQKYLEEKIDRGEDEFFEVATKSEILRDVAAGMIYLHSEQILHGDLSASNVLLNVNESEVVAKVAGFGQSRLLNSQTVNPNTATHGRSDIMPPEMKDSWDQVELTEAVDVFSFGCLIPHVAYCRYPEPRSDSPGGTSEFKKRALYISAKEEHVFHPLMKRCLKETPQDRGTFEEVIVPLSKYSKRKHVQDERETERQRSQLLQLQRAMDDLQEELAAEKKISIEVKRMRDNLEQNVVLVKQQLQLKEQRLNDLETTNEKNKSQAVDDVFKTYAATKEDMKQLEYEVKQKDSKMEQLHQQYNDCVKRCDIYCRDNVHLQKEVDRLSSLLETSEKEKVGIMEQWTDVEQQKQKADKHVLKLQRDVDTWKAKSEDTESELRDSKTRSQQLTAEMNAKIRRQEEDAERLTEEVVQSKQRLNNVKTLKEKANRERDLAISEREQTKKELDKLKVEVAKETEQLQKTIAAKDKTNESQQDKLLDAQKREQDLNDQLREYRDKLEATESARDKHEKSKMTLEAEKAALDKQMRELNFTLVVRVEDIGKKEKHIYSLMKDLEEAQKAVEEGNALEPVLRQKIEELEDAKKDLMGNLEKNVGKLRKVERELKEAMEAQKTLEQERDQKNKAIREREGECDRLTYSVQTLESELSERTAHCEELEKQHNEEAENCRLIEKQRDSASEMAEELQRQLKELYKEYDSLRKAHTLDSQKQTDLRQQLMEYKEQMKAERAAAAMEHDSASLELVALRKENRRIEESIEAMSQDLNSKKEELNISASSELGLRQRIEDLQDECERHASSRQELIHKLNELTPRCEDVERQRDEEADNCRLLKGECDRLAFSKHELERALSEMTAQAEEVRKQLVKKAESCRLVEIERASAVEKVEALQKQCNGLYRDHEMHRKALQKKTDLILELRERNEKMEDKLVGSAREHESVSLELEALRKEKRSIEECLDAMSQDLKSKHEELSASVGKYGRLESSTKQLERDLSELMVCKEALKRQYDEAAENCQLLKSKCDSQTFSIQELVAKLDEEIAHNGEFKRQLDETSELCRHIETARDSAIKRANDLQKQFSDLYKDHEKLRKVKVSELHGRMDLIKDLMESEQQNEADLDSADTDYQALKAQLEATAEDASKTKRSLDRVSSELEVKKRELESSEAHLKDTRQRLKAKVEECNAFEAKLNATAEDASKIERSLDRVSSELEVKNRELESSDKQLKDTRQRLKARVEECNAFENAQLHLLPRFEELQKERQQLDVQVVQMRAELAKLEAERTALLGQLKDFAVIKAENVSLKNDAEEQAGKAKKLTELEKRLKKEWMELEIERRLVTELKKKRDREFVSKRNLESTVKRSVRESFTERGEELLNASGMETSGAEGSEGSPDSVFIGDPISRRDMELLVQLAKQRIRSLEENEQTLEESLRQKESEVLCIQHQLDIAKQEIVQQKSDQQDAEKKVHECSVKIHVLAERYFESHRYPPFLYQLHQKDLPSSGVEGTSTMYDGGTVEVSDITDLRLFQPDESWCDEFQFLMNELKTMPSKEQQAYVFISFLHCGRVITFYRFHVVLVPQVLSCEQDLHPIELEGGAKPKAMLVYAHTQLRSNNLKEFGIKVHPKGVLLQPEFEGDIPELVESLDELQDIPAGLEDTERCLDARILHKLQCQYKRFATPVRTAPSGVAMAVI